MHRSQTRRVPVLPTLGVLAGVVALVHCGGGEHPPPAADNPVSSSSSSSSSSGSPTNSSGVDFDIDLAKGLTFGENGFTDCGKQAADKTITMTNPTNDVINFAASIAVGGEFYKVTPEKGGIPARSTATLKLSPSPIPAESDVTADQYAGTLEVKLSGASTGGPPVAIRLHQTARGAIIGLTPIGDILFGDIKVGKSSTQVVGLTNTGNAEVTATLAVGSKVITIDNLPTTSLKLKAAATETKTLTFKPTAANEVTDTLAISFNSNAVHCKAPPSSPKLSGKGTTAVGVSAGQLDFGQVSCGGVGTAQSVAISSTVEMSFVPVLKKGLQSPYTLANGATNAPLVSGAAISIGASASYELKVIPKAIDPVASTMDNAFGDELTITTDSPGDMPHTVMLRETAKGAVLSFSLQTVTTLGPVGKKIDTNFALVNDGNAQVPYTITVAPTGAIAPYTPGFVSNLASGNALVGMTSGVLSSFHPTSDGAKISGTMQVTVPPPVGGVTGLCADLPPIVPLQATGTGAAVTANPVSLEFGQNKCETQPLPQFVTLDSVTTTMVKVELGQGPGSYYTLAKANGQGNCNPLGPAVLLNDSVPVGPGAPYTLCVVPKLITPPAPTAPNGLGDTLKLTSDIAGEPVKLIDLRQTALGAFYSFSNGVNEITTVAASPTISNDVIIRNVGNMPGKYMVDGTPVRVPMGAPRVTGVEIQHPPVPPPPRSYTPVAGGSVNHAYVADEGFPPGGPVIAGIVITPDPDHVTYPVCSAFHSLRVFTDTCGVLVGQKCCGALTPPLPGDQECRSTTVAGAAMSCDKTIVPPATTPNNKCK